ncbi:MAG: lytic transglycosylase domain-containing protein [Candidatus Competibacteraceae bacterium]
MMRPAWLGLLGLWLTLPVGAVDIPALYREIAREAGVSPQALYTQALAHSGRPLPWGETRPWPWTVTARGERRFYPTQLAAWTAFQQSRLQGADDLQVGLLQLRWRDYAGRLGDAWRAFDPAVNLRAGAESVRPSPPEPAWSQSMPRLADRDAIRRHVYALAPGYSLDPELVLAVIGAESAFQVHARSPKNALGLMQLIPNTAERFGVQDPFDPLQNLHGGMAYLRWLLATFQGDLRLALAGYNAGEQAVVKYGGVPPYAETQAYVARILARYGRERQGAPVVWIAPTPALPRGGPSATWTAYVPARRPATLD